MKFLFYMKQVQKDVLMNFLAICVTPGWQKRTTVVTISDFRDINNSVSLCFGACLINCYKNINICFKAKIIIVSYVNA